MRGNQLVVVVDADVACASGKSEHPVSSCARKLLDEIKINGHYIAMCYALRSEWKKHQSYYATRWFASMVASKKVRFITHNSEFRKYIEANVVDETLKVVATKDAHLIDTALKSSSFIASHDNNARKAFCTISSKYRKIESILWLHSVTDKEFISSYLIKRCSVPEDLYLKNTQI